MSTRPGGFPCSSVLDECALILRLDDVDWSEEGWVSVEMVAQPELDSTCVAGRREGNLGARARCDRH